MSTDRPFRVLHVIESHGSGSLTAAVQYVRSTPELEHHMLRRIRDDYVPFGEAALFSSVTELPSSNLRCPGAVRQRVREIAPDVVHAHSSLAGVFVRWAFRAGGRSRIVYTPHCFVFERTSTTPLLRRILRLAEWLMAINTSVIAGCSVGEARVAGGWRTCRRAVHIPNYVSADVVPVSREPSALPVVVSTGRLAPQKDPDFFLATLAEIRKRRSDARGLWIGGGPREAVESMRAAGVEVTGWVSRDEVLALLGSASVYVHTAAWEGFPMSVLEAHRAGIPIVVRDIAAFGELPPEIRASTPSELADRAVAALDPAGDRGAANKHHWDTALSGHTAERQRSRLLEAYDLA